MWYVIGIVGGFFLISGFFIATFCAVAKVKKFMEGLK